MAQSQDLLRGLPGVAVVFEDVGGTAKDAGFDWQTCRTAVECKLHKAKIKVLAKGQDTPQLRLKVRLSQGAYRVSLEVIQGDGFQPMATKWPRRGVEGLGTVADVQNAVAEHVAEFVGAWQSVNGTA